MANADRTDARALVIRFDGDHPLSATWEFDEGADACLEEDFAKLLIDLSAMDAQTRSSFLRIFELTTACERDGRRLLIEIVGCESDVPAGGIESARVRHLGEVEPNATYGVEWKTQPLRPTA